MSSWLNVMTSLVVEWLTEFCKTYIDFFPLYSVFLELGEKKFQVLNKRFVLELINKLRLEIINKVAVWRLNLAYPHIFFGLQSVFKNAVLFRGKELEISITGRVDKQNAVKA